MQQTRHPGTATAEYWVQRSTYTCHTATSSGMSVCLLACLSVTWPQKSHFWCSFDCLSCSHSRRWCEVVSLLPSFICLSFCPSLIWLVQLRLPADTIKDIQLCHSVVTKQEWLWTTLQPTYSVGELRDTVVQYWWLFPAVDSCYYYSQSDKL